MGLRAGRVVEVGRGRHNCSRPRGGMINFLRMARFSPPGAKRDLLVTLITRDSENLKNKSLGEYLFRDPSL